eukprot:1584677-Karenia_brevis.AAC.1
MGQWQAAASRREDMEGIQHWINREATQALLSSKIQQQERGLLRSILAGGLWTQDRKCRARI